ncbi:MAG: efflux RND transporter periplasmic adaptor subunit [Bacteroidota bacterium]
MLNRQTIIVGVSAVVLVGLGIFLMFFLSGKKKPQPRKAALVPPPKVRVEPVQYSELETELEYYGRVGSFNSVDIVAEVGGMIQPGNVLLKTGQRVQKGQLLFQLDATETRLNLQSQKSQFLKSIADILADLKVDFPERFPVWQKYFSSIEVDQELPELPSARSTKEKTFLATRGIISSYYSILSAEERLRKYRVYAPFSGSLSAVMMEPGTVANPGGRVATLLRTDKLELILPVNAQDLRWVKKGAAVEIFSEDGGQQWQGKVARMGDKLDAATQSVNVYISVNPNRDQRILDGQYLRARVPGRVLVQAMRIPRKAVFGGNKVYIVEEGRMVEQEITIHRTNSESLLFSGIKEGQQIVVEPPVNAVNNMEVTIIGS